MSNLRQPFSIPPLRRSLATRPVYYATKWHRRRLPTAAAAKSQVPGVWNAELPAIRARYQHILLKHAPLTTAHLVPEVLMHLLPLEHQGESILPLWQDLETVAGEVLGPPYWSVAWPGGQAVARYLLDHPELVAGARVLDIASGCGVGALAAIKAGASSVVAVDIDPLACFALNLNAQENNMQARVQCVVGDAKQLTLAGYDVVMAGDVCFQRGVAEEILPKLQQHAAAGGLALLGDPTNMRPFSPQRLGGYQLEPLAQYTVRTNSSSLLEGSDETWATVWRLCA